MTNRKLTITLIFVAIAVSSFAGGFYAYKFFFAHSGPQSESERLAINGHAILTAFHSDGAVYSKWEGHNVLSAQAENAIAGCLSGNTTTPSAYSSCTSWINAVRIADFVNGVGIVWNATRLANNTPEMTLGGPNACNPVTGVPSLCTGWKTEAIFSSEFTQAETTINAAYAGSTLHPANAPFLPFDVLPVSPAIVVNPGDSLNVTISFTDV